MSTIPAMPTDRTDHNGAPAPPPRPVRPVRAGEAAVPARGIPANLAFAPETDLDDALSSMLLSAFVDGDQPRARSTTLQRVRPEAQLLPPGVEPLRRFRTGEYTSHLAAGDGWMLWARRHAAGNAYVTVTAVDDDLADRMLGAAIDGAAADPPVTTDRSATIGFWYRGPRGSVRRERSIGIAPWVSIRANYPAAVAEPLTRLMGVGPPEAAGRLLLLHGPPGTGKTTALRALTHAWRAWCQIDCVVDPEALFHDPGYLFQVLVEGEDGGDIEGGGASRWRLLVLEDCDELISAEAKQNTGQAMARLLNLTDGLLGQGRNLLVALTTNEPLASLHPALVRPGRCLAQIEIGRFPADEAAAWLGTADGVDPAGATLAELYQLRGDLAKVERRPDPAPALGQYL